MAYRSHATNTGSGGTVTVTKPTGVAADDILIACYSQDGGSGAPTWPTDFTVLSDFANLTFDGQQTGFAIKRATGSEGASYVLSGSGGDCCGAVIAFSGRHTTTAPTHSENVTDSSTADGSSVTASTVTAETGDDLCFLVLVDPGGSVSSLTAGVPTDFTERFELPGGNWSAMYGATRDNVSAGATGTITATSFTPGLSFAYTGYLIRIPAAAAGGDPEIALIRGGKLVGGGLLLRGGLVG